MNNVPEDPEARRRRRRAANDVQNALRDMAGRLVLLSHQVGLRVALKDVEQTCLELIGRYGSLSPSMLAKRAGLHPATVTGVLDRLERDGWVVRERDATDRRAVVIRALPDRGGELYRLYGGMRTEMNRICDDYDEEQLAMITGFLNRVATAGDQATEDLSREA